MLKGVIFFIFSLETLICTFCEHNEEYIYKEYVHMSHMTSSPY